MNLCEYLNNPLGVKFNTEDIPMGCVGSVGGLCRFGNKVLCIRYGMKKIKSFLNIGHTTVEEVCEDWAAWKEKPVEGYTAKVMAIAGYRPSHKLEGKVDISAVLLSFAIEESGMRLDLGTVWNMYDSVFGQTKTSKK